MGMEQLVDKYFRPGRLPHIWCPGCGNGVITGAIVKAVDKQGLSKDEVALISGIGCSSRSSGYLSAAPAALPGIWILIRPTPYTDGPCPSPAA